MILDLAIIGAGPAGLAAALAAARVAPGARIAVFDRLPEPARKLAVTGGGRGNLSHDASESAFAAAFGPAGRFVVPAFRALTPAALCALLRGIGLPTVRDPSGRIYPSDNSAASLRRALLETVSAAGVRIVSGTPVTALVPPADPGGLWHFAPDLPPARRVLLAAGGQSFPSLGSDGSGFRLAAALGHRIVPPVPGLAPLLVDDAPWLPPLAGISLPDAALRLPLPRHPPRVSRGPLLFTHRGLSGPAALDLSATLARAIGKKTSFGLTLAVLPVPRSECLALLDNLRRTAGARPLRRELAPPLPQRLADAFLALAGIPPDTPAARLPAPAADRLATVLCALPLAVARTASFAESMVTSGGVSLKEVDPSTLASRLHPTLFFAGEILDLDGPEGGWNLHWAFASGTLAARSALS